MELFFKTIISVEVFYTPSFSCFHPHPLLSLLNIYKTKIHQIFKKELRFLLEKILKLLFNSYKVK